ncbi:hypothetical protein [Clostridium scatologenes]|uniref:CRISPR-associated protein Csh1 n=1 Tax=Clostridium scatologenes TaxID=1548 RepID=A0A0E3JZ09_CLOSL|nr:hypothetical protein [Clostridium scatologenes]AKA67870.1 CRISPR-associated protein Csh1 [Clostridium scatologenes]
MISEISEVFKKQYEEKGEGLIIDNYVLAPGQYAMFTLEDTADTIDIFDVNKKTDTEEENYKNFAKLDYMSGLISMNKPVDPNKIIHSNNMYAFYVKKDNLDAEKGKLKDETIDAYYSILKNPKIKYKNKPKSLELYLKAEEKYGKSDEELIDKINLWIKENIYKIALKLKLDKTYLKLFYKTNSENYEKESEKYILPNIYNSTDYNVKIKEKVYGLPDFNMGLNSKKPYLENKTRKTKLPLLVPADKIVIQKKLFSYLLNCSAQGKNYVYVGNEIEEMTPREGRNKNFQGHFLRVNKGKEVEIVDSDVVTSYRYKLKRVVKLSRIIDKGIGKDFLPLKKSFSNLNELKGYIDEIFFSNYLNNNYFTEPKEIRLDDSKLKEIFIKYRYGFYTWFYKGEDSLVSKFWNKVTRELLCNSMLRGNVNKAINQFNLRYALLDYFKNENGGDNMASCVKNMRKSLDEKINIKVDSDYKVEINDDKEYYFCVGQLMQYFYALNKSGTKNYSFIRPILSAKNDDFIKEQLRRLFIKYSYAIKGSLKFSNMYYMVEAYAPEGDVDQDILIAGFLCPNLILKKSDKNNGEIGEDIKHE